MRKNNKRVVFVLVEGPTDKISLTRAFELAYCGKTVIVLPYGGDITTESTTCEANIKERIYEEMWFRLSQDRLDFDDVSEVVHVVDTDGAYVADKRIIADESCDSPFYNVARGVIRTWNKKALEERNRQKRDIIDCLVDCEDLFGIPYRVFYMSCNLDHVLSGDPNMPGDMKMRAAKQFVARYGKEPDGLIGFLARSTFSSTEGYFESWDSLRYEDSGLASIRRSTNLGIALESSMLRD